MLPEEQVRKLCRGDVIDLSISDLVQALKKTRQDSAAHVLSFDYVIIVSNMLSTSAPTTFDLVSPTGNVIASIPNEKTLLKATVIDSLPEGISMKVDQSGCELKLSIWETSQSLVLY